MSDCNLVGTIKNYDGSTSRPGTQFKVIKVLPGGGSTTVFGTHVATHTLMNDGTWSPLIKIERKAVAYVYCNAPGFDASQDHGTPLQIPDSSSATLASLAAAVSLPQQVPVALSPATPIVVEGISGSPAYPSITQIEFDLGGGFVLTQPSAGKARLALNGNAIPLTSPGTGTSSTGTLTFNADSDGNGSGKHSYQINGVEKFAIENDGGATGFKDKGSQVFNVKAYLATGDGSTNDYMAINAALTAAASVGGIVYFPPGVYKINTRLQPASNVFLMGAGIASMIKGNISLGAGVIDIASKSKVRVSNLGITSVSTVSAGVTISASTDCIVDHVWFDADMQWNVLISANSQRCGIIKCTLSGSSNFQNLEINASSYCFAINCTLMNATSNGIELYHNDSTPSVPVTGNKIIGCHIEGATGGGIFPSGDIGSIIEGNTIVDCGNHGFWATQGAAGAGYPSLGGRLINNTIINCGAALGGRNITLGEGTIGWTCEANTSKESGGVGIFNAGTGNTVSDNFCYLSALSGIYSEADGNIYKGNRCFDNSAAGAGQSGIDITGDSNIIYGQYLYRHAHAQAASLWSVAWRRK
jgi:hypothetical protein